MRSLPLLLLAFPWTAHAAELTWEGNYRARAELFDTLSLSRSNPNALDTTFATDHRLRLQPGWLISSNVGIFTQVDLLPFVQWGQDPLPMVDPITGDSEPVVFADRVVPPTTSDDGATLQNIQVTRLWGEVRTNWGRFRFGRVPVEWGTGMVFNAGNAPDSEYGDTTDRVEVLGRAGDVYVMGAAETRYEGYTSESDDYRGVVGSISYRTETSGIGSYNTYRWMSYDNSRFGMFITDLWAEASIGPAKLSGEFAAVIGSGDLDTGANGVSISAFGGNIDASMQSDKLRVGLGLGVAGGDANLDDNKIHTFSFDPDFNKTLMLFEQPMPILAPAVNNDSNEGRNTKAVRTGDGISNAVYLAPRVGWQLQPDLTADLTLFAAQQAKLPDNATAGKGYGTEIDLTLHYTPYQHFDLESTTGVLLPGKYFSDYEHEDLGGGFDATSYGTRLMGTVTF